MAPVSPVARARRHVAILSLAMVGVACAGKDSTRAPGAGGTAAAPDIRTRTPHEDTVAVLDSFARIVQAIDTDTLRFERRQQPVTLGAGITGALTALRAGRIWQKLHVDANGDGFQTSDTYWFSNGALLGARLQLQRNGRKASTDRVWFRDRKLYLWIDGEGRHLLPAARSTQYEVQMMRSRLDSLISTLDAEEMRTSPRR